MTHGIMADGTVHITVTGTALGITAVGTTLGSMADGMTLGIMATAMAGAGTADGMIRGTTATADGTVAGTEVGTTILITCGVTTTSAAAPGSTLHASPPPVLA